MNVEVTTTQQQIDQLDALLDTLDGLEYQIQAAKLETLKMKLDDPLGEVLRKLNSMPPLEQVEFQGLISKAEQATADHQMRVEYFRKAFNLVVRVADVVI